MNTKLEVIRLANEDVISTSGAIYTCENSKYHFIVLDVIEESHCLLLSTNNGSIVSQIAPNSVDSSDEIFPYLGNERGYDSFLMDLGQNSAAGDWYYFNGSGWSLCSVEMKTQHMDEIYGG